MTTENQRALLQQRHLWGVIFEWLCFGAILICLAVLVFLIGATLWHGWNKINWAFFTSLPSGNPAKAGIAAALAGSAMLMVLTTLISVPIGVATAVFLEEYASKDWWVEVIRTNIANLAGVPSVVYGMLGLGLFAKFLALGETVITGALTLSLVVLPVIIIASQEALRAVPSSLRNASLALGATRWQTIWYQVLPAAIPGIMTGVILALSRAIGEAAPLVTVGAVGFLNFVPRSLGDPCAALPLQIYDWVSRPQTAFHDRAAGAIIVLMAMLVTMNAAAILIRYHYSKNAVQ
jgi:phosphate transport system permease protein